MDSLEVMTELLRREFTTAPVMESAAGHDSSAEELISLQTSLRDMRGLICYLLQKNQQLRLQLSSASEERNQQ